MISTTRYSTFNCKSNNGITRKILSSIKNILGNKYTLLFIRIILGSILVLAAIGKIPEQAKFIDVVSHYGLLPWSLAQAYGLILPWLELILGTFLILGLFTRLAAAASILMIVSFIIANGTAVYSKDVMECGCFGLLYEGTGYVTYIKTSDALVIDIFMTLMALILLLFGAGAWSVDSLIRPRIQKYIKKKAG